MRATSPADSGMATMTGVWSTARFHAWRATSYSASPGAITSPAMRERSCARSVRVVSAVRIAGFIGFGLLWAKGVRAAWREDRPPAPRFRYGPLVNRGVDIRTAIHEPP